jgi:hypothetical protein
MRLESFKNLAEAIHAVVSTLAIIIGGSWANWKFVIQKEREPRAEFDLTAEFIGRQDGKWPTVGCHDMTNVARITPAAYYFCKAVFVTARTLKPQQDKEDL